MVGPHPEAHPTVVEAYHMEPLEEHPFRTRVAEVAAFRTDAVAEEAYHTVIVAAGNLAAVGSPVGGTRNSKKVGEELAGKALVLHT